MKKFIIGVLVFCVARGGWQIWKNNPITYAVGGMREVKYLIQQETAGYRPEDVLCCLDIDDTLIQLDYPPLSSRSFQKHKKIFQSLQKRYCPHVPESILYFMLCAQVSSHVHLADYFLSIRHLLPSQTIAFTASGTETCLGQAITTLRYEELKRLGISFEEAFPFSSRSIDSITFENGTHPEYYRGILFSSPRLQGTGSKGAVLCAFLKTLPHLPKCVLLVDDHQTNIHTVQQSLHQQFPHIRYIGIWYNPTAKLMSYPVSQKEFTSSIEALLKKLFPPSQKEQTL